MNPRNKNSIIQNINIIQSSKDQESGKQSERGAVKNLDELLSKIIFQIIFNFYSFVDNYNNLRQSFINKFQLYIKLAIIFANPTLLLSLLEFSQNISYLGYVNQKQSLGFDQIAGIISYSHFTEFANPSSFTYLVPQKRLLSEQQNQEKNKEVVKLRQKNAKLKLNNKTDYFIFNALFILIIQILSWILSFIFYYLDQKINSHIIRQLKKIFNISIPLLLFLVCSQEGWLLIFYQLQILKFDPFYDTISFIFCILLLIYMVIFLGYLFYKLEYKKSIKQYETKAQKSQLNKQNSEIFLNIIDYELNQNLEKFYLISKYIKQDTFMTRNIVQILVIYKLLISCIYVQITNSPFLQIIALILSNIILVLYLGIYRPFKSIKNTIFLLVLYAISTLIAVIYTLSIIQESNSKNISFIIGIILIICVFMVFPFYFLVFMLYQLYKCLKKIQKKQQKLDQNKEQQQLSLKRESISLEKNSLKQDTKQNSQNVAQHFIYKTQPYEQMLSYQNSQNKTQSYIEMLSYQNSLKSRKHNDN